MKSVSCLTEFSNNMFKSGFLIRRFSEYVPADPGSLKYDLKDLKSFFKYYRKILVLTGAGISTESGIPDYRSEKVGAFARGSYKPITHSEFVKNPDARTRYWARNFLGWPKFKSFQPNTAHFFITEMEYLKKAVGLVTQNVDGLHSKAGCKNVVELHGNSFWVQCMSCEDVISRFDFQKTLENCNPFITPSQFEMRPDGDVELAAEDLKNFKVPSCEKCGGILKPTVVFFGDNVPKETVQRVDKLVEECDSMLILGTSLTTLSSFRIVEQVFDLGKFLCLINLGPTRADNMVDMKINTRISNVISSKNTALLF